MTKWQLKIFTELSSTNRYALDHLDNLDNQTVIIAKTQKAGYGRYQRPWVSEQKDNLYFSIVLKGEEHQRFAQNLTQYTAIILCRLLTKYRLQAAIKWPNDLLIENKKVAGILCETVSMGSKIKGIVIGIGINLNWNPQKIPHINQPATALNIILGQKIESQKFLESLLEQFQKDYQEFLENGFISIQKEYIKRSFYLGNLVKINSNQEIIAGKALKIDQTGALILQVADGQKRITMGDML